MGSSQVQGALWGVEARVWSETLEPITRPLFEQVHDELGTGGATRLLDAGCGSGLALQIAAGRGAEVARIDAAAGMLEIARERNPDAELHEGDLEELPWDDDRFDAVTHGVDVDPDRLPSSVVARRLPPRGLTPGGKASCPKREPNPAFSLGPSRRRRVVRPGGAAADRVGRQNDRRR